MTDINAFSTPIARTGVTAPGTLLQGGQTGLLAGIASGGDFWSMLFSSLRKAQRFKHPRPERQQPER